MKIKEAQAIYQVKQQELMKQHKQLSESYEQAKKNYEKTGNKEFSDQAVTLQLSMDANDKRFKENQKLLEELNAQRQLFLEQKNAKEQEDAAKKMADEYAKIMTVAMRITRGDKVPYKDEKKLMEYDFKLYMAAKNAQTMQQMHRKKIKEYKSLWKDEKEAQQELQPDDADADFELGSAISVENAGIGDTYEDGL